MLPFRWIHTGGLVFGSIVSYVGFIFLLMAFCSPYWIESYEESFSNFKNMGLWEYCFKEFYYPYYQFPRKFNGCHNIFSNVSDSLCPHPCRWSHVFQTTSSHAFPGILCHSWVPRARLAALRPSMHNDCIHLVTVVAGNFGPWIGTMAIENRLAIRMADDEGVVHLCDHIQ